MTLPLYRPISSAQTCVFFEGEECQEEAVEKGDFFWSSTEPNAYIPTVIEIFEWALNPGLDGDFDLDEDTLLCDLSDKLTSKLSIVLMNT